MDTKTNDSPTINTSNIDAIAAVMALLILMNDKHHEHNMYICTSYIHIHNTNGLVSQDRLRSRTGGVTE